MNEITTEDFRLIFVKLWRHRMTILLVTLAGSFAGLAIAESIDNSYTNRATSYVCVAYTTYQEQMSGSSVLSNYSEIVTSNRVCRYAASLIDDLGISAEQIRRVTSIRISGNSYVMSISSSDSNPAVAMRIANAVAEAFVVQITAITGNSALQVLDTAYSVDTIFGNERRTVMFAATAGAFALICLWFATTELFSDKVRSVTQCIENEDEILTIIPYAEKDKKNAKNMLRGVVRRTP